MHWVKAHVTHVMPCQAHQWMGEQVLLIEEVQHRLSLSIAPYRCTAARLAIDVVRLTLHVSGILRPIGAEHPYASVLDAVHQPAKSGENSHQRDGLPGWTAGVVW